MTWLHQQLLQGGTWLAAQSGARIVGLGLGAAILVELLTCALRFGLGLQATRDTSWLAAFTFGLRIHHGYLGLLALAGAAAMARPAWRNLLLGLGLALFVSDLLHHFVVLWLVTGSPDFPFRYPTR